MRQLKDIKKIRPRLRFYFIADDGIDSPSMADQTRAAVSAGADIVQYRRKDWTESCFPELASVAEVCRKANIPLIINDRVDLAFRIRAAGVHLGQEDLPPAEARRILGPEAIIGISVADRDELAATFLDPCDYIGAGPVYATDTKPDAGNVIGISGLKDIISRVSLPVVAIGGINADRAGECLDAGAAGVAVISDITRSENPARAAERFAAACYPEK